MMIVESLSGAIAGMILLYVFNWMAQATLDYLERRAGRRVVRTSPSALM